MVSEKKIFIIISFFFIINLSMGANDPQGMARSDPRPWASWFKVSPIISLCELYMGMAAILIYGQCLLVYIFNPPLTQGSLKEFGPGVSEKKSFKGVNGRTGIDHSSSS